MFQNLNPVSKANNLTNVHTAMSNVAAAAAFAASLTSSILASVAKVALHLHEGGHWEQTGAATSSSTN